MKLMLSCKESVRLMLAREDRDLPFAQRTALRIHLWMCSNCPRFEDQIALTRRQLDRWKPYRDTTH